MTSSPKFRVAIVGGGIGGLTLALALTRLELDALIQVDIYEAAAKLTQVGAGITFWPRGWEIVKALGLEDALVGYMSPGQEVPVEGIPKRPFLMKKGDQREDVRLPDMMLGSIGFHRADIQTVLLKHISPNIQMHLNKRLVSYRESGQEIELRFKNGETATCDLLVGADGVHSAVRKGLLARVDGLSEAEAEARARPVWSGSMIYRGMIDSAVIREERAEHPCLTNPMVYLGKTKHVVTYPISRGTLINVAAFVSEFDREGTFVEGPAVAESTTDAVASLYAKWSEEAQCITRNMHQPSRWAVEVVRPLDRYADGCVFLLGDAAHAMAPHLGNGAAQAIEDAYILAQALNKALRKDTAVDVSKIAEVYNTVRQPFGNSVADASRSQGRRYDLEVPGFEDVNEGDAVSLERLMPVWEAIEKEWRWTWDSFIDVDVKRALEMI